MSNPIALKISLTYAKTGRARFHSHHDMMRFFARALRRADLPLRHTEGFNPHPRIVFPHALGLGMDSSCEIVEIEFSRPVTLDEVERALRATLAPVLEVLDCKTLPCKKQGQRVLRVEYRIAGWTNIPRLRDALDSFLAADEILVERGVGRKRREVNARVYVDSAVQQDEDLILVLRHTETGAGRPDEICRWLARRTGEDERDLNIEKRFMETALSA